MSDKQVYTKQDILEVIALYPCHVTDPRHTIKGVCELQRSASFKNLLNYLGITEDEIPRKLHDNCYWCHGDSDRRDEPELLRRWAGL